MEGGGKREREREREREVARGGTDLMWRSSLFTDNHGREVRRSSDVEKFV